MAVGMSNTSPVGDAVKFNPFFAGGLPAPVGGGNNVPIPQSTSQNVLTDKGAHLANWATSGTPSPITALAGAILLLALIKFAGEHNGTAIDPADLHIGAYNLLAVTATAIIGIVSLKLIFNSIHVPGITPLVNFV